MKTEKNDLFLVLFIYSLSTTIVLILLILVIPNGNITATYISGAMGMTGGIVGALSAYFIAKMQMTKQLDLQYKKEKEKTISEIKINKYQEISNKGFLLHVEILNLMECVQAYGVDISSFYISEDKAEYKEKTEHFINQVQCINTKMNKFVSELQALEPFMTSKARLHLNELSIGIVEMRYNLFTSVNLNKEDILPHDNSDEEIIKEVVYKYVSNINNEFIEPYRKKVLDILSLTEINLNDELKI